MTENNVGYFSRSNDILNDFISKLAKPEQVQPEVNKDQVLKDFDDFESLVKNNPEMKRTFAALQKKFANEPEFKSQVDPNFVAGVMMLDLSEAETK